MNKYKDVTYEEMQKHVQNYKRKLVVKISDTYNGSCIYYEDPVTLDVIARYFDQKHPDGYREHSGFRVYL